jgi:hypothetical protein
MHELLLDRRLRQILRDDGFLEGPILLGIFQRLDDRLGGQSMLESIAPGPLFSVFGPRASALERIEVVCFELPERGHKASDLADDSSAAGAFAAAGATWLALIRALGTGIVGPVVVVVEPARRVFFHNISASLIESSPRRRHQARSSRERCASR